MGCNMNPVSPQGDKSLLWEDLVKLSPSLPNEMTRQELEKVYYESTTEAFLLNHASEIIYDEKKEPTLYSLLEINEFREGLKLPPLSPNDAFFNNARLLEESEGYTSKDGTQKQYSFTQGMQEMANFNKKHSNSHYMATIIPDASSGKVTISVKPKNKENISQLLELMQEQSYFKRLVFLLNKLGFSINNFDPHNDNEEDILAGVKAIFSTVRKNEQAYNSLLNVISLSNAIVDLEKSSPSEYSQNAQTLNLVMSEEMGHLFLNLAENHPKLKKFADRLLTILNTTTNSDNLDAAIELISPLLKQEVQENLIKNVTFKELSPSEKEDAIQQDVQAKINTLRQDKRELAGRILGYILYSEFGNEASNQKQKQLLDGTYKSHTASYLLSKYFNILKAIGSYIVNLAKSVGQIFELSNVNNDNSSYGFSQAAKDNLKLKIQQYSKKIVSKLLTQENISENKMTEETRYHMDNLMYDALLRTAKQVHQLQSDLYNLGRISNNERKYTMNAHKDLVKEIAKVAKNLASNTNVDTLEALLTNYNNIYSDLSVYVSKIASSFMHTVHKELSLATQIKQGETETSSQWLSRVEKVLTDQNPNAIDNLKFWQKLLKNDNLNDILVLTNKSKLFLKQLDEMKALHNSLARQMKVFLSSLQVDKHDPMAMQKEQALRNKIDEINTLIEETTLKSKDVTNGTFTQLENLNKILSVQVIDSVLSIIHNNSNIINSGICKKYLRIHLGRNSSNKDTFEKKVVKIDRKGEIPIRLNGKKTSLNIERFIISPLKDRKIEITKDSIQKLLEEYENDGNKYTAITRTDISLAEEIFNLYKQIQLDSRLSYGERKISSFLDNLDEDLTWIGQMLSSAQYSIDPLLNLLDKFRTFQMQQANIENIKAQRALLVWESKLKKCFGIKSKNKVIGHSDPNIEHFLEKAKYITLEIDDNGNITYRQEAEEVRTGNIISNRVNWGIWEKNVEDFKKKKQEDFKKLWIDSKTNPFDLNEDTKLYNLWQRKKESGDSNHLYGIAWMEYYSKFYKEFHEQHSTPMSKEEMEMYGYDKFDILKQHPSSQLEEPFITAWKPNVDFEADVITPSGRVERMKIYENTTYENLSETQRELIDEYKQIKMLLDKKVNSQQPGSAVLHRLPQFRGNFLDRCYSYNKSKDADNLHIWKAFQESVRTTFHVDSEDYEYGSNATVNSEEESLFDDAYASTSNFYNRLPLFGINKLDDMTQLSSNLVMSTMAYATMANTADNLDKVAQMSYLLRDNMTNRKIGQQTTYYTSKTRDNSGSYTFNYTTLGSRAQVKEFNQSKLFQRWQSYVEMQIFGKYFTLGKSEGEKKAQFLTRFANSIGSRIVLAGKSLSGSVNSGTARHAVWQEANVGKEYTHEELRWAAAQYFKTAQLVKTFSNALNPQDKVSLFMLYNDPEQSNIQKFRNYDSHKLALLRYNWVSWCYNNGTYRATVVPVLAKAKHTKLYRYIVDYSNPNKFKLVEAGNVYDSFNEKPLKITKYSDTEDFLTLQEEIAETIEEKIAKQAKENKQANPYYIDDYRADEIEEVFDNDPSRSRVQDGIEIDGHSYYIQNSEGKFIPFTIVEQSGFSGQCRRMLNNMHGIYNQADAAAVSQDSFGSIFLTLKKYIYAYWNKFYAKGHYDAYNSEYTEGIYHTLFAVLKDPESSKILAKNWPYLVTNFVTMTGSFINSDLIFIMGAAIHRSLVKANRNNLIQNMQDFGYSQSQAFNIQRFYSVMWAQMFSHILGKLFAKRKDKREEASDAEWEKLSNWQKLRQSHVDRILLTNLIPLNYAEKEEAIKFIKGEKSGNQTRAGLLYVLLMGNAAIQLKKQYENAQYNKNEIGVEGIDLRAEKTRMKEGLIAMEAADIPLINIGVAHYVFHRTAIEQNFLSFTLHNLNTFRASWSDYGSQLAQLSDISPAGFMFAIKSAVEMLSYIGNSELDNKPSKYRIEAYDKIIKNGNIISKTEAEILKYMYQAENDDSNKIFRLIHHNLIPYRNEYRKWTDPYKSFESFTRGQVASTQSSNY